MKLWHYTLIYLGVTGTIRILLDLYVPLREPTRIDYGTPAEQWRQRSESYWDRIF